MLLHGHVGVDHPMRGDTLMLTPERIDSPTAAGLGCETGRSPEQSIAMGEGPACGQSVFPRTAAGAAGIVRSQEPMGESKNVCLVDGADVALGRGREPAESLFTPWRRQIPECWSMAVGRFPLGEEIAATAGGHLSSTFRELPFANIPGDANGDSQPVTVRTAKLNGQGVYAVNDSPLSVTLRMQTDASPNVKKWTEVSGMRRLTPPTAGSWSIELEPFELLGVRFAAENVQFSQPQAIVPDAVSDLLDQRVRNLRERTAVLVSPPQLAAAPPTQDLKPRRGRNRSDGLQSVAGSDVNATLVRSTPHTGNQALSLSSAGASGALLSEPFPAPNSGRLSYSVWLRVPDVNQQPTMRLAIEGDSPSGRPFYRFAPLGQGPDVVKLRSQWSQYIFKVDDLAHH